MTDKNCALAAAFALALGACNSATPAVVDSPDRLMHNDFEQAVGWGGAGEGSLTTTKAHSGKWSVQVTPSIPFGFTFERTLGGLAAQLPHKMRLRGWALRTTPGSNAQVVVQVNASATDTTKIFYAALPLASTVREFDKWQEVSLPFTLPATAGPGNVVKIYLWRDQATTPAYLDDVALFTEK